MLLFHLLLPFIYSALFFFSFPSLGVYLPFVAGVLLGFSFFFFDRLLDVFFLHEKTELSVEVRNRWKKMNYFGAMHYLYVHRQEQQKLLGRSPLFMGVYFASAFFFLTSTGSSIAVGVILGMGLHFCFDLIRYIRTPQLFHEHFLWQVKRQFSEKEMQIVVGLFIVLFAVLTALVLFRA